MPSAYCVVWDRGGVGGSTRVVIGLKNLYDKYFLHPRYFVPDIPAHNPTFSICNNAGQWVLPGGGLEHYPNTPAGAEQAALDEFWQECWIDLRRFIEQGSARVRARFPFPPAPADPDYWGIYIRADDIEDVLRAELRQWQPGRNLHFELREIRFVGLAESNMFGPAHRPLINAGLRGQEDDLRDGGYLPQTLVVARRRRGRGRAARVSMMLDHRNDDGSWFDRVLDEMRHV